MTTRQDGGRCDFSLFKQRHFAENMQFSWCCEFCEILSFVTFFSLSFLGIMNLKNQVIYHGHAYT